MNAVPRLSGATHLRRASLAATLAVALIATLLPATTAAADDTVTIPDDSLRSCLSAALTSAGRSPELTATNLATLTDVSCSPTNVMDITGVESLTGAQHLTLRTTASDLTPLRGLTRLVYLVVDDPVLTDASPIAALTGLIALYVSAPRVTSYDFALGHPRLARAFFHVPLADDLEKLAAHPALYDLTLATPSSAARAAVGSITGLTRLSVSTDTADGLDGISVPTAVTSLTLAGNELNDLTGLEPSEAHTSLRLTSHHLVSLDGLGNLPNLTALDARYEDKLRDISALANHPDLTTVDLTQTDVVDLSALSLASQLSSLNLYGTKVADLAPLRGHTALRALNLAGSSVTDLGALAGIPLTSLNAPQLGLSDVTALEDLGPHAKVWLEGNHIKDFSPLPDDANVSMGTQTLPDYPDAHVGTPFNLGLRSTSGQPLCPQLPASAACSDGMVTYPLSGTYRATDGSFTFTQYAGPNRTFARITPTIQGNARVGADVGAGAPLWKPTPATQTIQWFLDGRSLAESGTSASFRRITAGEVGHRIMACHTASLDGFDTVTVCTPSVSVNPGTISTVPHLWLRGITRVRRVLKVAASGPWEAGVSMHYQWYRDNKPINGATSASYRLSKADRGHRIKLRIRATKLGYTPVVRYTPRYRIR